ncbi:MAG TPA: ATP-binding protein [Vicinamibacterales bacterium]|nr:ATP-binding protein [Vicinamibacterales bacterium]
MAANPFVYGEVVPASAFVGREVELDRLSADLLGGQKVFLISPRRYGKSSLVRQALAAVGRRGALTVDVTVSSYSSYVAFLEGYARALVSVEARLDRARAWLRDMLGAVRHEVRLETSPGGRSELALSFPTARTEKDVSLLAAEVFALPGRIAAVRGRKMAVALDEFQAIGVFNGGSVEHALRAAVQHQREVGYVFSGSEPALMERMLGRSRPFYKAGPVMRLDRIPAGRFADFLEARFRATRIRPEAGLGTAIVELAGNLPYDVQRLAHEVWDDVRAAGARAAGLEDLHETLKRLLGEHDTLFEGMWQRLTLGQRATLRAAVLEDGRELLSADVRGRYRLSGASTVQASLAALVREDILARDGSRYVVVDSLLREWVARKTF